MKSPVAIYVVHHPECKSANLLARSLYDFFASGISLVTRAGQVCRSTIGATWFTRRYSLKFILKVHGPGL